MKLFKTIIFLFLVSIFPLTSYAGDLAHVASSPFIWEENKKTPFGFKLNLGFNYESYGAKINKEYIGDGSLNVVNDLAFSRSTSTINIGGEFGVKGVSLFFNLPIIFSSQSSFKFQDGSLYPGNSEIQACRDRHPTDPWVCNPDGVSVHNSRTVRDGIVNDIYDPANLSNYVPYNGSAGPRSVLKSPDRHGVDQLHLGIRFNVPVFNQFQDKTKPYWILALDVGLPIGKIKDFKRTYDGSPECNGVACTDPTTQRPDLNSAVGRGIYDITFSSLMSKTDGIFNSYFKVFATLPFAYTSDSLYADKYNFDGEWGMKQLKAPIKGGILFGSDFNVYNNTIKKVRINLFARGLLKGVFQGYDYSEAYELLAGSPMLNGTQGINPSAGRIAALDYFPGLTTVENYAVFAGQIGINFRVTRYFFMELSYGLKHHTEHFLTYTDAGDDDGTAVGGKRPGTVDLDTKEANPYYRPIIDQVGKRYRIQESMIHSLFISFSLMY